jgi:hypothetical protein
LVPPRERERTGLTRETAGEDDDDDDDDEEEEEEEEDEEEEEELDSSVLTISLESTIFSSSVTSSTSTSDMANLPAHAWETLACEPMCMMYDSRVDWARR